MLINSTQATHLKALESAHEIARGPETSWNLGYSGFSLHVWVLHRLYQSLPLPVVVVSIPVVVVS